MCVDRIYLWGDRGIYLWGREFTFGESIYFLGGDLLLVVVVGGGGGVGSGGEGGCCWDGGVDGEDW